MTTTPTADKSDRYTRGSSIFRQICWTRSLCRTAMYLNFSRQDACSFSRRKFSRSMKTCHSLQTAAQEAQPRCFWREVSSRIIRRISIGNEAQKATSSRVFGAANHSSTGDIIAPSLRHVETKACQLVIVVVNRERALSKVKVFICPKNIITTKLKKITM